MTLYVVTGPPAGGKTTWVRDHAKYGDIVIDYDDIVAALHREDDQLSGDPAEQPLHLAQIANVARQAAIDAAMHKHDMRETNGCDVYIVHTTPSRQHMNRYRKHGAQVILCNPGHAECMRRAVAERTPRQQQFVQDWYERRQSAGIC